MPGSRLVRLWGTIPPTGYVAPMAIEDPAEFAAASLRMLLTQRGISVTGTARARHRLSAVTTDYAIEQAEPLTLHPVQLDTFAAPVDGRHILASHQSPPVAEDIVVTNKVSQNLHAELLLRMLGSTFGADGSYAQGVRVVRQFLLQAGVAPQDFFFHDGSGMSMSDLITPRAYTTLLAYAARQPWGAEWRRSLPVGGEDGTLAARFGNTPLNGRIQAKTGSLSEVSTLSGYLTAASGKTLVFSILVKRERGDGRAVTPDEIVPAPADAVGLPGEERVVADDVAVDGANAPRGQLVTERGEVGERVAWRERMVGGFAAIAIGVVARAHRRVTGAEQDEVAVECAVGVDGAGGDEARGPGERVDGQQGRGGGGGEQFGIRCRGEALFVVPGEEDAAVERGDAHADVRLSERGRGEDGQEALGECGIGLRLGLRRGGASGEGAGEQADGEQDAARKKGRHRRSVDDRAWMGEQEFCYFMWILARIQRLPKTKKAMVQTTTAAGNPQ